MSHSSREGGQRATQECIYCGACSNSRKLFCPACGHFSAGSRFISFAVLMGVLLLAFVAVLWLVAPSAALVGGVPVLLLMLYYAVRHVAVGRAMELHQVPEPEQLMHEALPGPRDGGPERPIEQALKAQRLQYAGSVSHPFTRAGRSILRLLLVLVPIGVFLRLRYRAWIEKEMGSSSWLWFAGVGMFCLFLCLAHSYWAYFFGLRSANRFLGVVGFCSLLILLWYVLIQLPKL